MRLPDGPRQIFAGLLSSLVFMGLYFAASLVWWLSLGMAIASYFALLLLIRRKTPLDEIMLSGRVSEANIRQAGQNLATASERLQAAAQVVPDQDKDTLFTMVHHLRSLQTNVVADPQDYQSARRFINFYLPHMIETVETYADLAGRAGDSHADRLATLGARIRNFAPLVAEIDRACLENDFDALEVQVDVLATQMKGR